MGLVWKLKLYVLVGILIYWYSKKEKVSLIVFTIMWIYFEPATHGSRMPVPYEVTTPVPDFYARGVPSTHLTYTWLYTVIQRDIKLL